MDKRTNSTSVMTGLTMEATSMVCYAPKMIISKGVWMSDNPLKFSVPIFVIQLLLVISTSRLIHLLFKPFRQPRALSEILCGIILGPAVLGRNHVYTDVIFPLRSLVIFDTMANIGLVYSLFLVGLEMDVFLAFRVEKRAVVVAVIGVILPFIITCFTLYLVKKGLPPARDQGSYIIFLAFSLSVSAFPVLTRLLVELKILHTDIGRLAMESSFINDVLAWVLQIMIVVMTENNKTVDASPIWVILCSAAFVGFCIFIIRPAIWSLIRHTPEGESFSEFSICLILAGVMISGFITEAIGMHAIFGAFVFGLVIPNGPFGAILVEKLEDFVTSILLPLYYASSGLKAKIKDTDGTVLWVIILITIFASLGKLSGTIITATYYKIPLHEAIALGFLMNAKGLIEMVIINLGMEHNIIDGTSYSIMLFASVIVLGMTIPIVSMIYRPAKKPVSYRGRAIGRAKLETELRILVAIHNSRNVPTIINLLQSSNPTDEFPLCVYVLHLSELTARTTAILIVHDNEEAGDSVRSNRKRTQSDHVIKEFKILEQHTRCISIQPLTAISPYSTMHEDICNLAEDKHVAFIIIPFHKQQTVDGEMTCINPDIQIVNQKVVENAVCSVGILVDRGLSGFSHITGGTQLSHHIVVLFFGGPDDREALAYAMRMAQDRSNSLTVVRFIPGQEAVMLVPELQQNYRRPRHIEKEKQLDDDYIRDFGTMVDDISIIYTEKVVNNSVETVAAVMSMENINYDLFIVGRRGGQGTLSILTQGLTDWTETPELGAIGDLLVSPDFPARVSVLVVQHYIR